MERVFGTIAGVIAARVTTMLFHSTAVICIAILAVAPLISHHHANRYWLHTGLIGLIVLLGYDLTPLLIRKASSNLMTQRLQDIVLGTVAANDV